MLFKVRVLFYSCFSFYLMIILNSVTFIHSFCGKWRMKYIKFHIYVLNDVELWILCIYIDDTFHFQRQIKGVQEISLLSVPQYLYWLLHLLCSIHDFCKWMYTWGLNSQKPHSKVDTGSNLMHYVLSVNLSLMYAWISQPELFFFRKKKKETLARKIFSFQIK